MTARSSLGRGRPSCQAIGCREPATATVTQLTVPATGRLELELKLCPVHRAEAERGLALAEEVMFEAGLSPEEATIRAGWAGIVS
jgi:hypothetical protein